MALTVPVLSKFPATARITSVSSGINLAYGQVDGRLVIGDDEISLSQINCMYEFPYGDLLVGFAELGNRLIMRVASVMAKFQSSTGSLAVLRRALAFSRMNRMEISTNPFCWLVLAMFVSCVMPWSCRYVWIALCW